MEEYTLPRINISRGFFFYVILYGYENKEGDNGMQMLRVSLVQGESLIWV